MHFQHFRVGAIQVRECAKRCGGAAIAVAIATIALLLVWSAFAPTVVSEYREPSAIPYVGHALESLGRTPFFMEWTYDTYRSKLVVYGCCSWDQLTDFLSFVDIQLNCGFGNEVHSNVPDLNIDSLKPSYVGELPASLREKSEISCNDPSLFGSIKTSTGKRIRVGVQRSPRTGEFVCVFYGR